MALKRRYVGERVDALFFRMRSTPVGECWVWNGSKQAGYGKMYDATKGSAGQAHRLALESALGRRIGAGKFACHTCDNRLCVRPTHLFEGTRQDNSDDMVRKGRQQHGSKHFATKTTEAEVALIKYLAACGVQQKHLGLLYQLPQSSISQMVTGRTWQHVAPLEGPH